MANNAHPVDHGGGVKAAAEVEAATVAGVLARLRFMWQEGKSEHFWTTRR